MSNPINLPSSFGGYVTPDALTQLNLTQTTTPGGGTGYKDSSGTIYTFNGNQFVPLPVSVGGTNTQVPTTSSSSSAAPASGTGSLPSWVTSGNGTVGTTPNPNAGYVNPNSAIVALPNLSPGSTGADVTTLQKWLVANGYLTQAQMDTGPGTYGPQTTAAVAAWQKANNIDTQGNPGYFGPISRSFLTTSSGTSPAGGTGTSSAGGSGTGDSSTGNSNLDSILDSLKALLAQNAAVIPPGLQITPALTQQFLSWAHQVVDPQTQQLIQSEIKNINASSQNLATQYGNNVAQTEQQFGTDLASEQNQAGASGTAFSGMRNLTENNMAASTNRTLSSLASDAGFNIGQGLRTSAANVGAANAGGINTPTLNTGSVSQFGGSRGTTGAGSTLDFGYDPSMYTAGVIPSNQNTAVNDLAGNYLSQYGTLAGANSGKSMSDLISGITGLPAGYQLPSNLT